MVVKIDPDTIQYPEVWTKETQPFGTQLVSSQQQEAIEKTAPILQKIKERPTILFATPEDKMLGIVQMAVDNHKVETVSKWLLKQNIAIASVPAEDVPLETQKGLAVFNLVNSSIPELVANAMTLKFGDAISSQIQYEDKIKSLPDRSKYLIPPTSLSSHPYITEDVENQHPPPLSVNSVETQSLTIDHLRDWYSAADKLGKSEDYKQRIVEVAHQFKLGEQLPDQALAAMNQDTEEFNSISRLTQIAQRVGMVWGEVKQDGFTQLKGKVYDLTFNTQQKDLIIAHKNGEVVLDVQSGQVQTNRVTPELIQAFERANSELDKVLAKTKRDTGWKFDMQAQSAHPTRGIVRRHINSLELTVPVTE
ncbi:hypothetical protein [Chlorogloeopsis sp. ULAP01]|uniref:hypothetical protein n=1 Tax=Chlorogloeopsis sp. ULAP01 TaxID=3056483 RepID=UPI003014D181